MSELTEDQREQLLEMYYTHQTEGSKYPGQTYEDGINAVLDLLDGNCDLEDVIG